MLVAVTGAIAQMIDLDHRGMMNVNGVCLGAAAALVDVGSGVGSEVGGVEIMAKR
jgi:hypothetical protein